MKWGSIPPTDVDGLIDFGNKLFVLFELKHTRARVPYGQRLAIERVVDAIQSDTKEAFGIIATHDSDGDIVAAEAIVTEYRYRGEWIEMGGITLIDFIDGIKGAS